MTMLPRFMDRLDPERRLIFHKLNAFKDRFVLAGGTAIMLQIGARLSYDFDCFIESWELPLHTLAKAHKVFGEKIALKFQTTEMITISTEQNIEISFVCHPFKILRPVIKTGSIGLFHLDDLAASKAYTIGRRNTWRDYVDLFIFMKKEVYSLEEIMKLARLKFGPEFNEKLFVGQLSYFDDLDIVPINFLNRSFSPGEIKAYLENQVSVYVRNILRK